MPYFEEQMEQYSESVRDDIPMMEREASKSQCCAAASVGDRVRGAECSGVAGHKQLTRLKVKRVTSPSLKQAKIQEKKECDSWRAIGSTKLSRQH